VFPGRDGIVHPKTKVFTPSLLAVQLEKSIDAQDPSKSRAVAMIMAEILSSGLADLEVALPESGYIDLEVRTNPIPTYQDLEAEILRQAILGALERVTLTVEKRKVTRITLTVLEQILTPVLLELGRELRKVREKIVYFKDTIEYARRSLVATLDPKARDLATRISDNENIQFLTSNFTLANIALNAPSVTPVTADFELPRAFEATVLALRSSSRYRVKSLREFADSMGHVVVENHLGVPRALVVYKDLKTDVRSQVTEFLTVPSLGQNIFVQVPIPALERYLDRALSDTFNGINTSSVRERLVTAISLVVEQLEVPHVISLNITPDEIMHYAVSTCERVILCRGAKGKYHFQLATDISRKGYLTESPTYNGLMHASDPAEYLLVREDKEAQASIDIGMQTIPDEYRQKYISTPLARITSNFTKNDTLKLDIGGQQIECEANFEEMFGVQFAQNVKVTVQPAARAIVSGAFLALEWAESIMKPAVEDEGVMFNDATRKQMMGAMMLDMIRPIYDTPAAAELTRSVIDRVMNKEDLSADARRALRIAQHHKVVTLQIQVWLSLVLLNRAGYLDFKRAEWVNAYLHDNNLYALMASTMLN
jgi:hypothetical protein